MIKHFLSMETRYIEVYADDQMEAFHQLAVYLTEADDDLWVQTVNCQQDGDRVVLEAVLEILR